MIRSFIILSLALVASEGFRLWWFSAPTEAGEAGSAMLQFAPELVDESAGPVWRHQRDDEQRDVVDGLLGHDRAVCGVWLNPSDPGQRVHYSWVEYDAGNTRYLKDLFGHPPEVCVGKSGARRIAIHPDCMLRVGDCDIAVRHVEFAESRSGLPFQIFKFVWLPEGSPLSDGIDARADLRFARLKAAAHRLPRCEARMMIAVVFGAASRDGGWERFNETVVESLSSATGVPLSSQHRPTEEGALAEKKKAGSL